MRVWVFVFSVLLSVTACVHSKPSREPAGLNDIRVIGGDSTTFVAKPLNEPISDSQDYDVIVVGAGLAGLSGSIYLSDKGKKILLLERETHLGGLAAFGDQGGRLRYDRGAAYWTDAYEEEKKILNHIGLKDFKKRSPIPEPIDSYLVNGQFYPGIWENDTLKKLPAAFDLFKFELEQASRDNLIPNQPFEEFASYGGRMDLDRLDAKSWIEQMPAALQARLMSHPEAAGTAIYQKGFAVLTRFQQEMKERKLSPAAGMLDVIGLIDLYSRSALGSNSNGVSAMAFANFYISELETRYTTDKGTGVAAENMVKMLMSRPDLVSIKTGAPVLKIIPGENDNQVLYNFQGKTYSAKADYVMFASQVKIAPLLIEGFAQKSPVQAQLMANLGYSHYSVHIVHTEGHPFRATYDTWVRAKDYTEDDFTDVILGRWMDPRINAYLGFRDFKNDPRDREGILSIYNPLPQKWNATAYDENQARAIAWRAVGRMQSLFSQLSPDLYRGPLKITEIETSRWPLSVHIAQPGHYLTKAKILRKPFGRVFFANNNLGTPAFEEALFRGHCAANNILKRMKPSFKNEKWSRCPLD